MKKCFSVFLTVFLLIVFTTVATADTVFGKRVELSGSGSIWISKYKESMFEGESTESFTNINFRIRVGIFLTGGLEFEPELGFTIPDESDQSAYFVLGNFAYNFNLGKNAGFFLLAGAGIGNGLKIFSWLMDTEASITALNFGGGFKVFMEKSAALRIEYRYTNYSTAEESVFRDRVDNTILFGLSIFL